MKMNFRRRFLLLLYWIASLAALTFTFLSMDVSIIDWVMDVAGDLYSRIALIAFGGVYLLLSLWTLALVFGRGSKRSERGFITMDASESGRVRIAVSAIEQMVRQAVCAVDGISEMKIGINGGDDMLTISVDISVFSGTHVPTITMNMQRAIREYVEMNCGVAVQSVSVSVQAVTEPGENVKKSKRGGERQETEHVFIPVAPVKAVSVETSAQETAVLPVPEEEPAPIPEEVPMELPEEEPLSAEEMDSVEEPDVSVVEPDAVSESEPAERDSEAENKDVEIG